jgi:cytochrome c-type biogenesis protein CcmF
MIGGIVVKAAFLFALCASFLYYRSSVTGNARLLSLARYGYHAAVAAVLSFCAYLIYLILTHQFQYTYVWNYSSTDLPTPLLISTFYAGQEGSFSLWALFTSLVGVFLMQYTGKRKYEEEVMSVWSLILAFLLVMLVVKNPFEMIWDAFPADLVKTGALPAGLANFVWLDRAQGIWAQYPVEGRSLNPLLQNYWMVIHPQILFMGFTSMAVPFVFALAGLRRREYQDWVRIAKPWTVFGAAILGTGIILGGYWAYETLGWGGYWGWDPVENSSLIPWLVCIASIHTMIAQRRSGTFVRTNFVLSILCFLMVLYSTFLTRSGVLGDTSVHSFVDPGMWVYWLLLGFILIFGGIGFGLFLRRAREMPRIAVEHSIYSREFALFIGAYAICFAALFITIGTSSPIITTILKGKAAAVDTAFYVKTTLPIGIVVALLAGLGQVLWWRNSSRSTVLKSLLFPFATTVLFTIGLVIAGVQDWVMIVFAFAASFALFVNLSVGYRIFVGNPRYAGGAVAHIGVALLFLGFLASSRYDDKETLSLEQGTPIEAMGYTLTYSGSRQIDAERYGFTVDVRKGDQRFQLTPVLRFSSFTNSMLRHPDVLNMYTRDFYVAPLSVEPPEQGGGKRETLVVEASVKPYINLVWMGTITLVVGFVLTILRRVREANERTEEVPPIGG